MLRQAIVRFNSRLIVRYIDFLLFIYALKHIANYCCFLSNFSNIFFFFEFIRRGSAGSERKKRILKNLKALSNPFEIAFFFSEFTRRGSPGSEKKKNLKIWRTLQYCKIQSNLHSFPCILQLNFLIMIAASHDTSRTWRFWS